MGVADSEPGAEGPDDPDDDEEDTPESVGGKGELAEVGDPGDAGGEGQRAGLTEQGSDAGGGRGQAEKRVESAGDGRAAGVVDGQRSDEGQACQYRLAEQPDVGEGHLPVTCRSAATMASGGGGQPRTTRSTGTMSATPPTTAYPWA